MAGHGGTQGGWVGGFPLILGIVHIPPPPPQRVQLFWVGGPLGAPRPVSNKHCVQRTFLFGPYFFGT